MLTITDAVILMAGSGSRLQANVPKPLVPIAGRPLISYIFDALQTAGVRNLHVVVGDNSDALIAKLRDIIPAPTRLNPISNPDWQKQNGLSVLCAEGKVIAPYFLAMGDHLFDAPILKRILEQADRARLNLAVDRKIETIFDLDDAMKVQTRSDRVTEIGKELASFDAIDTGLFLCPNELFSYLRQARTDGDCSLADGVRLMARDGKVRTIDIGDAWWQDVDTLPMRLRAEEVLRGRLVSKQ
jgi:1L-myo-inositol 1-phosphate cytidylyltransferase